MGKVLPQHKPKGLLMGRILYWREYYTTPAACVCCPVTPEGATATEG